MVNIEEIQINSKSIITTDRALLRSEGALKAVDIAVPRRKVSNNNSFLSANKPV